MEIKILYLRSKQWISTLDEVSCEKTWFLIELKSGKNAPESTFRIQNIKVRFV